MTHLKSNNTIMTDAPTDNHGKGEAFSPTDTVCGAISVDNSAEYHWERMNTLANTGTHAMCSDNYNVASSTAEMTVTVGTNFLSERTRPACRPSGFYKNLDDN